MIVIDESIHQSKILQYYLKKIYQFFFFLSIQNNVGIPATKLIHEIFTFIRVSKLQNQYLNNRSIERLKKKANIHHNSKIYYIVQTNCCVTLLER